MMDLKEIIKWFIPCFHIFLVFIKMKMDFRVTVLFVILLFSFCSSCVEAKVNSANLNVTKELSLGLNSFNSNLSLVRPSDEFNSTVEVASRSLEKRTMGRTFGRPFKKMAAALIPLVFQLGAASTWAVVAAILGFKTLLVTLVILKVLLLAGAAKFGALFASHKSPHHQESWDPKKEIHLHIHNGHHDLHEEHISASPWSREGVVSPAVDPQYKVVVDSPAMEPKYKVVMEPYAGPQTISTPFGNYVKIDPGAKANR